MGVQARVTLLNRSKRISEECVTQKTRNAPATERPRKCLCLRCFSACTPVYSFGGRLSFTAHERAGTALGRRPGAVWRARKVEGCREPISPFVPGQNLLAAACERPVSRNQTFGCLRPGFRESKSQVIHVAASPGCKPAQSAPGVERPRKPAGKFANEGAKSPAWSRLQN
jgi:hypothetical protein